MDQAVFYLKKMPLRKHVLRLKWLALPNHPKVLFQNVVLI